MLMAFLLLFFCGVHLVFAAEEVQENYRVLFISSYSYTWSTVPLQIEGITSELADYVTLDIEYMDTKTNIALMPSACMQGAGLAVPDIMNLKFG